MYMYAKQDVVNIKATNNEHKTWKTVTNKIYTLDKVKHPPNPPRGTFWKNSALLETGNFTSSNGVKLLPGKKYMYMS